MKTRLDRRLTARDLDDLPHEWDTVYELIGGVLYMAKRPSNHHQIVLLNICIALKGPVSASGGTVVPEPGLVWEDDGEDNVSPDVAVVLARLDLREKKLRRCPDIAVEILSPGVENVRRDLEAKRDLYWRRGGSEYWIVDLAEQTVLRLTRGENSWREQHLSRTDTIRTPLLPAWKGVTVADFFDE